VFVYTIVCVCTSQEVLAAKNVTQITFCFAFFSKLSDSCAIAAKNMAQLDICAEM
jgi:hypothetical protein